MSTPTFSSLFTTRNPEVNDGFDQRARLLGYIWSLMMTSPEHRTRRFEVLERIFNPAFRHDHIVVLFNSIAEPVAYFVWAYLAPDVEERIIRTGVIDLHISEWNEGDQLWILDCAVRQGYFPNIVKEHLHELFPHADSARFYKKRKDKIIWKEISREGFERMQTLL